MRCAFTFAASVSALAACGSPAEAPDQGGVTSPSCGGDLVGLWHGIYSHNAVEPTMDPCHELNPSSQPDGRFFVGLSFPPPDDHLASLEFGDDATFRVDAFARGPVQQNYPSACLSTGDVTLTCDQLAAGLTLRGSGEGGIGNVTCSAATGLMGGCDCSWDVHYGDIIFAEGAWSTSGDQLTLVVDRPEGDETITASYCVEFDSLQLGTGIDHLIPDLSGARLVTEGTCRNGHQDRFEAGIDCGGPCGTTCP